MRWMLRIFGGVLLLVVVALGGLIFYLNEVVGTAIEEAGTRSLGVKTSVSGVLVRPISGKVRVFGLEIANPDGFDKPTFLKLGAGFVNLSVPSLRTETIEISQIHLEKVELDLEKRNGRLNTDAILDNMSSSKDQAEAADEAGADEPGKGLIVRELLITDVTAYIDMVESMGDYGRMQVEIPEIRLENLGAEDKGGQGMSELSDTIVKALLSAVAKHSAGLSLELTEQLAGGLNKLGGVSFEVVGKASSTVVDASGASISSTSKALDDVAAGAGKATKNVADAIGNLFDRDDD